MRLLVVAVELAVDVVEGLLGGPGYVQQLVSKIPDQLVTGFKVWSFSRIVGNMYELIADLTL